MAANQDRLVALLVDLENVAGLELQRVFEVAATEGQVVVRRVYGEFNLVASRKQQLQDLAFDQSALFNTTSQSRKNGADIFLAIEAMDLLHRQVVDVFVLVTGDSDYARLARRLREGGKRVVGIGSDKPSATLVQSCDRYELIAVPSKAPAETKSKTMTKKAAIPEATRKLVATALSAVLPDEGQIAGAKLHNAILRLDPAFEYDRHAKSFRLFLEQFPELELVPLEGGDMAVRRRAPK